MPNTQADRERLASFLMPLRSVEGVAGRLMAAVEAIPRRPFMPEEVVDPYEDRATPIACGQTMPSARHAIRLVAALKVLPESRILEIGTGSGYVTALLARLGLHVTTLERYKSLIAAASDRVKAASLTNTTFVQEDGRSGYAEMGPFDRIVVHGSFETIPRVLLDQLASHGILIAAVGPPEGEQRITSFHKLGSRFEEEILFAARLQPLESGIASFL